MLWQSPSRTQNTPWILKSEDHFFNSDASPYTHKIKAYGFVHLYCALHPARSTALAWHHAPSPGLPGISTIPFPKKLLQGWAEGRVCIHTQRQFLHLSLSSLCKWSEAGVEELCSLVSGELCRLWLCQGKAALHRSRADAAGHTSAAPLGHGGATKPHSPATKEQTFQRKIWFHPFHKHFKAHFNHSFTTACCFLLLSRPCSHQVQWSLFPELNRSAPRLSQPPAPHFWWQSAVFQLCVWSRVSVLPDLTATAPCCSQPPGPLFSASDRCLPFEADYFPAAALYCRQRVSQKSRWGMVFNEKNYFSFSLVIEVVRLHVHRDQVTHIK